ncbi:MAG: hypothetical protein QNL51_09270 [Opitutaceae bacterium]
MLAERANGRVAMPDGAAVSVRPPTDRSTALQRVFAQVDRAARRALRESLTHANDGD